MLQEAIFRFPHRWVKLQRAKKHTYKCNKCHGKFHELGFLFSWGWQHLWVLLVSGGENILILLLSCHLFKLTWTSQHLQCPWSSLRKGNRTPSEWRGSTCKDPEHIGMPQTRQRKCHLQMCVSHGHNETQGSCIQLFILEHSRACLWTLPSLGSLTPSLSPVKEGDKMRERESDKPHNC